MNNDICERCDQTIKPWSRRHSVFIHNSPQPVTICHRCYTHIAAKYPDWAFGTVPEEYATASMEEPT